MVSYPSPLQPLSRTLRLHLIIPFLQFLDHPFSVPSLLRPPLSSGRRIQSITLLLFLFFGFHLFLLSSRRRFNIMLPPHRSLNINIMRIQSPLPHKTRTRALRSNIPCPNLIRSTSMWYFLVLSLLVFSSLVPRLLISLF